jgi:hypothetical protein
MSEHSHTLDIDTHDSNLPNESFISWLRSQTALLISQILGLASGFYVIAALIYYLKHNISGPEIFSPANIQSFIIYAHIPFLLLFVASLLNILDYNVPGSYRSRSVYTRVFNKQVGGAQLRKGRLQLRKFKIYFLGFWIFMLVLYFSFIFQINFQSGYELPNRSKIIAGIREANNATQLDKVLTNVQSLRVLTEDPKTKKVIEKLSGSNDEYVVNAIKLMNEVDTESISARAINNIKESGKDLGKIEFEIRRIDNSKEILVLTDKIRKISSYNALPDIVKGIDELTLVVTKIQEINPNGLSKPVEEIKKITSQRRLILSDELQSITTVTRRADNYLTNRPPAATDWGGAFFYLKYEAFIFAANNLSVLWIFLCFTVLAVPWHRKKNNKTEKRLRINGALVILFITLCFPLLLPLASSGGVYPEDRLRAFITLADAVSGIINAIILALLIARLDSKFIGLHSYLITVLYGYAAVQPLFVVFEQGGEDAQIIKALVLVVVFIFKIHFFLIITYALQTGRMLDYLICFPTLAKRVDSIFSNQFEIRTHADNDRFSFSIQNKNAPIYLSNKHYDTRDMYIKELENIRKLMKCRESYEVKGSGGTYWVEVSDSTNKICYSTDLRSEEEAKELIIESMEKIPYCKGKLS